MRRIIFLDIDGVLNSNFWNESHQKEISDGKLIDEEKVRVLAQLVKRTGAEIILHSGWRFWFDSEMNPLRPEAAKLAGMFSKEGLVIAGVTPDLTTEEIRRTKKFSFVKADEILLWLEEHSDVSSWVVLDDLDLHNDHIEKHQVRTDQTVGLTSEDIAEAEKILTAGREAGENTASYVKCTYDIASLAGLNRIWEKNIENNKEDKSWVAWREEYIDYHTSGKSKTFLVSVDGEPVGEGTLLFCPECRAIGGRSLLADGRKTANINALRIEKAYEDQGHISRLVKLMEKYAKDAGYESLTIGVEAHMTRNLAIYLHWGYREFVLSEVEDGVLVLYYQKKL